MSVIVYSTTNCPWCKRAKAYLDERGVAYTDVNVELDETKAQEMVEKSGQMGVPVLDINGEIVVGFDKEQINSLLHLA